MLARARTLTTMLPLVALLGFALSNAPPATGAAVRAQVEDIKVMEAETPFAQQIAIVFSQPIWQGDAQRNTLAGSTPGLFTPPLNCRWRWLDEKTLACQLGDGDRMVKATTYTLELAKNLRFSANTTPDQIEKHTITTQKPAIQRAWIKTWRAPGVPVLRVVFNQPVSRISVAASLKMLEAKLSKSMNVLVSPDSGDHNIAEYKRSLLGKWQLKPPPSLETRRDGSVQSVRHSDQARFSWLVEPARPLQKDSRITVRLNAGLLSALGPVRGDARREVLSFHTFPAFRFLGLQCTSADGRPMLIDSLEDNAAADEENLCDPGGDTSFAFTTPVPPSELEREIVLFADRSAVTDDTRSAWPAHNTPTLDQPHQQGQRYSVPLPGPLLPRQRYSVLSRGVRYDGSETVTPWSARAPQTHIHDSFGRVLMQAIDLKFPTGDSKPDYSLPGHDLLLSLQGRDEPLLSAINLDRCHLNYRLLSKSGVTTGSTRLHERPTTDNTVHRVPLGIRQLTGNQSGVVYGHIVSEPDIATKRRHDRHFFAQVTPYQVHVKIGPRNTLAWVSEMATGAPVANARVAIYPGALAQIARPPAGAHFAQTDEQGRARLPGTQLLDPRLETFGWRCNADSCKKLFVHVSGTQGIALLPLNRRHRVRGAGTLGAALDLAPTERHDDLRSWGTTAQRLYRTGETIHYKLYVRRRQHDGYTAAPTGSYTLDIAGPGNTSLHRVDDVTLNKFGAYHGAFSLPPDAAVGWYDFRLIPAAGGERLHPLRVLVTEAGSATVSVHSEINEDLFRPGDSLFTRTEAHSADGARMGGAKSRVSIHLQSEPFIPAHPDSRNYRFDSVNAAPMASGQAQDKGKSILLEREIGELSFQGLFQTGTLLEAGPIAFGSLYIESAVWDDTGQLATARSTARFLGSERYAGLRRDGWFYRQGGLATVYYIATDSDGEPVDDTEVEVLIEYFGGTESKRDGKQGEVSDHASPAAWRRVAECSDTPPENGLSCSFVPDLPGLYRTIARVEDRRGNRHRTVLPLWVAATSPANWHLPDGDKLELTADRTRYQIGETARILLKSPFPRARALVSLERADIVSEWFTTLDSTEPVIEIPLEASTSPGVYLSVVAYPTPNQAPQTADQSYPMAEKSNFAIGYTRIAVEDPATQIEVTIASDRDDYRAGDRIEITAQADRSDEPIEFAAVVIAEQPLAQLSKKRAHFDPYQGFYTFDETGTDNYNLQALPAASSLFTATFAADAGSGPVTAAAHYNLSEETAYWNPSLPADEAGRAGFTFELPESDTDWRVVIWATTPSNRFGTGERIVRLERD